MEAQKQYELRQFEWKDLAQAFNIIKSDGVFPYRDDHASFLQSVASYFDLKKGTSGNLEKALKIANAEEKTADYARTAKYPISGFREVYAIEQNDNHEIVGVTELETLDGDKDSVWINWTAIRPDKQRQGIGTASVKQLENLAKKAGMKYIKVSTDSSLTGAMNFYRKNGFAEVERLIGFYQSTLDDEPVLDKIVYSKELK